MSGTIDTRRLLKLWANSNPYEQRSSLCGQQFGFTPSEAGSNSFMPNVGVCAVHSPSIDRRMSRAHAQYQHQPQARLSTGNQSVASSIVSSQLNDATSGCSSPRPPAPCDRRRRPAFAQPLDDDAVYANVSGFVSQNIAGSMEAGNQYLASALGGRFRNFNFGAVGRSKRGGAGRRRGRSSASLRDKSLAYCLSCLDFVCIWQCCGAWLDIQRLISLLIFDPFAEMFVIICILINTLFMALDTDDTDAELRHIFERGNYFFTATFAVEALMKIVAQSPKFYFREGWNVFDAIVVALSMFELSMQGYHMGGRSLSVLRSFRLLRVFKLARTWPMLNNLLTITGKAIGDLGNLTFVLAIIVFIFAVMGMQLFGNKYTAEAFPSNELPRWNFTDFMHSFMIVFRILCAEWIEPMWDCLLVAGWPCVPFFLLAVTVGNLVVLNLFLALLLASFGASNLSSPQTDSVDTKKLQDAVARFSRLGAWLKLKLTMLVSLTIDFLRSSFGKLNFWSKQSHELELNQTNQQSNLSPLSSRKLGAAGSNVAHKWRAAASSVAVANSFVARHQLMKAKSVEQRTQELKTMINMKQAAAKLSNQSKQNTLQSQASIEQSNDTLIQQSEEQRHLLLKTIATLNNNNKQTNNKRQQFRRQDRLAHQSSPTKIAKQSANTQFNQVKIPIIVRSDTLAEQQQQLYHSDDERHHNHHHIVNMSTNCQMDSIEEDTIDISPTDNEARQQTSDKHKYHNNQTNTNQVRFDESHELPEETQKHNNNASKSQLCIPSGHQVDSSVQDNDLNKPENTTQEQYEEFLATTGDDKDKTSLSNEDERELEWIEMYIDKCICLGKLLLRWFLFRRFIRKVVEHRHFEQATLVLIIVSSGTLALEDKQLVERPNLRKVLDILDTIFTVIFSLEMILKWTAFGLRRYFGNIWSWLDFVIVVVSLVNLMASIFGSGKIQALKTMRTLRAMRGLRPLRALQRFQGMRVVVNALIQAIPGIFNVLVSSMLCLFGQMSAIFNEQKRAVISMSAPAKHVQNIPPIRCICQPNDKKYLLLT